MTGKTKLSQAHALAAACSCCRSASLASSSAAPGIENRGQRAGAAAIRGERSLAPLRRERQHVVADARGLDARRFPLRAHRFDLGRAHPQRVLAHFARGVLLLQLGRVFALLARPRRPGQVDRKHQRHHVGVGRAADGIRDFRAPVGQLRRAGDVGLGRGHRLLRAGEMDFRLRLDVGQARRIERQARDVGRVAQAAGRRRRRCTGRARCAHAWPASKPRSRGCAARGRPSGRR